MTKSKPEVKDPPAGGRYKRDPKSLAITKVHETTQAPGRTDASIEEAKRLQAESDAAAGGSKPAPQPDTVKE